MKIYLFLKKKKGFTLVELIISLAIFTFGTLALAAVVTGMLNMNRVRQEASVASELIKVQIEKFKVNGAPSGIKKFNEGFKTPEDLNDILPATDNRIREIYKNIRITAFVEQASSLNAINSKLSKVTIVAYKRDSKQPGKDKSVLKQYSLYIPK